ncbi:MAG: IS3 family transposase, partial [Methylococcales bacterium]|nr:IS3 family transposase [Methylococcales bacterium]
MILLDDRQNYEELINEAIEAGASKYKACKLIGLSIRTLQRWQAEGKITADKRPTANRPEPA